MNNRISNLLEDSPGSGKDGNDDPRRINEVLEELFTQYERRFPGVKIVVVETPATAI